MVASGSARREDFKKKLSKTDLPFRFCIIGLSFVWFVVVVVCLLQLCPILAYLFLN